MKRITAILLTLLVLSTVFSAVAEEAGETAPTVLVVANPTPMQGQFFTEMWGNATSDNDVRDLLHAYNLIYWNGEEGMFTIDPSVVSGVAETPNAAGDHTFILVLYDDLYFSDGSRITAWDYAFSYLLSISPLLEQLGANPLRREQLAGYQAYVEGGGVLSGVRVLSDDTLSVTLNHEYLPFFYEVGLLSCVPYPISVIAPGVEVRDDGQGVYLANIDPTITEPLWNVDLLAATILNPETGYQSHPAVVSGPYTLVSWDGVTAEFEINPFYKGNSRSEVPVIQHLTYTTASNDTVMALLRSGEVDLVNKVMRSDVLMEGMRLVAEGVSMSNYLRTGLSYISFACERDTVSSEAVRQAIACCFDRDAVVEAYTGAFGMRVDSYYGAGQWMYDMAMGSVAPPVEPPEDEYNAAARAAYEEQLAAYEALSLNGLNPYALDTALAAQLLEEDGWTLNAAGLRERGGVVLNLHLIYPEGNNIGEALQTYLVENLETVGIRLSLEAVPMGELLSRWYQHGVRHDDMIYLASNFDLIFDPSANISADGAWNHTGLVDEALMQAAIAMRQTEPGDVLTYMQHWVAFENRFNALLPMIPVYSNVYFDFYRGDLQNYAIAENVTWAQAIVGAWIGEPPEEEAPVEDEDLFLFD